MGPFHTLQEPSGNARYHEKDKKEISHYDTIDAVLDTLDSIGLAAFAIIGAQNGIRAGTSMVVSAICGMTTSTFGGLTVSDFVKCF